jgi:hypothetical protein
MAGMADRQSWQTGKRKISIRGALHRGQSAGNRAANRLSARPLIPETNKACLPGGLVSRARVWSWLLLKTDLPRPRRSWKAPLEGTNWLQYNVSRWRQAMSSAAPAPGNLELRYGKKQNSALVLTPKCEPTGASVLTSVPASVASAAPAHSAPSARPCLRK